MRRSRRPSSLESLKSRQSASSADCSSETAVCVSSSAAFRGARVRSGPWVRELIDPPQAILRDPSVDLRGSQINVSQQLLHGTQVRSPFEQVRRERVPACMRGYFPARDDLARVSRHESSNVPLSQPLPTFVVEQRRRWRSVPDEVTSSLRE